MQSVRGKPSVNANKGKSAACSFGLRVLRTLLRLSASVKKGGGGIRERVGDDTTKIGGRASETSRSRSSSAGRRDVDFPGVRETAALPSTAALTIGGMDPSEPRFGVAGFRSETSHPIADGNEAGVTPPMATSDRRRARRPWRSPGFDLGEGVRLSRVGLRVC